VFSFNIITIINTLKILYISLFGYLLPLFITVFIIIASYFNFQMAYNSDSIYSTLHSIILSI
jgi:hypothetical protein